MSMYHIRDKRSNDRYYVDNELIKRFGKELGPYGVSVYNVIVMHADNETQDAYPSYQTIADYLGISRRKVMTVVKELEELNIIAITERKHEGSDYNKSNLITLIDRSEWGREVATRHSEPDAPYSEPDAPYIVNEVHPDSESGAPELNPITKPNRTKDDKDKEKTEKYRQAVKLYEGEIGLVSPIAAQMIGELVDEYPLDHIGWAMEQAVKHNARNLSYVKKCLENRKAGNNGPGKSKSSVNGKAKRTPKWEKPATVEQLIKQKAAQVGTVAGEF